jgi:SAM-dependent methyltransferase
MTGSDTIARKDIRKAELDFLLARLAPGSRVLEIGAGSGYQASLIAAAGHAVDAVDVQIWEERQFDVVRYDGANLPFEDARFDAVFSSNVLEHVVPLDDLEAEIRRVLKPDGFALHVVPSHWWRLWNSLTWYPALPKTIRSALAHVRAERRQEPAVTAPGDGSGRSSAPPAARPKWRRYLKWFGTLLASPRHGERGNRFTEFFHFHPSWWRDHFRRAGFRIEECRPSHIYYSGNYLLGPHLPLAARQRLSRLLGSSTWVYLLRQGE